MYLLGFTEKQMDMQSTERYASCTHQGQGGFFVYFNKFVSIIAL